MSSTNDVRLGRTKAAHEPARSTTLWLLGALALVACGGEALDFGENEPEAPSPSRAGRRSDSGLVDNVPFNNVLFGPNEFASADHCSASQRAMVFAADALAEELIRRAQDALAELYIANDMENRFRGSDPLFEGNFGPLNKDTWAEVYDRYTGINDVIGTNVYSCHEDGDLVGITSRGANLVCGTGNLVATTNGATTSVRLCPDFFFSISEVQRAGTLIHETSHQDRSYSGFGGVGTDDRGDASPNNAARYQRFAQRFNCTAGSPRCPTVF